MTLTRSISNRCELCRKHGTYDIGAGIALCAECAVNKLCEEREFLLDKYQDLEDCAVVRVDELREPLDDAIRRAYCAPVRAAVEGEDSEVVDVMAKTAIVTDPDRMRHLSLIQDAAWRVVTSPQLDTHGLVHGPDCRECTVEAMDQCTGTPHETASRLAHTLRAYGHLESSCEAVKRENRELREALTLIVNGNCLQIVPGDAEYRFARHIGNIAVAALGRDESEDDRHCYVCGNPDPEGGLSRIGDTNMWVCAPDLDETTGNGGGT